VVMKGFLAQLEVHLVDTKQSAEIVQQKLS